MLKKMLFSTWSGELIVPSRKFFFFFNHSQMKFDEIYCSNGKSIFNLQNVPFSFLKISFLFFPHIFPILREKHDYLYHNLIVQNWKKKKEEKFACKRHVA